VGATGETVWGRSGGVWAEAIRLTIGGPALQWVKNRVKASEATGLVGQCNAGWNAGL